MGGKVVKFGGKEPEDWKARISRTREGNAKADAHNVALILSEHPDFKDLFALDVFANRIVLKRKRPWRLVENEFVSGSDFLETDGTMIAAWLGRLDTFGMSVNPNLVLTVVETLAREAAFHPVRAYLDPLKWDGVTRIESFFPTYYGTPDNPYAQRCAAIMLVSAVARIYKAASKVDTMVVLESQQGFGKNSSVMALFGPQFYAETTNSPADKDFYQGFLGNWVIVIAEMAAFSRSEIGRIKQAITVQSDSYRPSYGRYTRKFARQSVFIGDTNTARYLKDPTGGRRFLPVRVLRQIDVAGIERVRDQLWAEAVHRYRAGEDFWTLPPEAREEQDERFDEDGWTDPVRSWMHGKELPRDKRYPENVTFDGRGWVVNCTTSDVLSFALRVELAKQSRADQMRVGDILERLGWINRRERVDGQRVRRWRRPEDDSEPPF